MVGPTYIVGIPTDIPVRYVGAAEAVLCFVAEVKTLRADLGVPAVGCGNGYRNGGFHSHNGTPKWMVYNRISNENG